MYRLLSQAYVYPSDETFAALTETDLPLAQEEADFLMGDVRPRLAAFADACSGTDAGRLRDEHRQIFSHVLSADCPPCEVLYTARHVFQETQDLSDLAGFFRAFGLELEEKERPDHISVELEFMHLLACKEAYAFVHHGLDKVRLCRGVQRTFVEDHLGRWAMQFADQLEEKAGRGYFARLASLTRAFVSADVAFLRATPEVISQRADWSALNPGDDGCPGVAECPLVEMGADDERAR